MLFSFLVSLFVSFIEFIVIYNYSIYLLLWYVSSLGRVQWGWLISVLHGVRWAKLTGSGGSHLASPIWLGLWCWLSTLTLKFFSLWSLFPAGKIGFLYSSWVLRGQKEKLRDLWRLSPDSFKDHSCPILLVKASHRANPDSRRWGEFTC